MDYEVEDGVIYCDKGIAQSPRWFADSRLIFRFDESGITQVDYRNPAQRFTRGSNTVLVKRLRDVLRYFIEADGVTYKPEYLNSKIWPFGIESEWTCEGATFKHRVMAVAEAVIIQLTTPSEMPDGLKFKMEFWEASVLCGSERNDYNYWGHGMRRTWDEWRYVDEDNALYGRFTEVSEEDYQRPGYTPVANNPELAEDDIYQTELNMCMTADFSMEHSVIAAALPLNAKHILKSGVLEPDSVYSFILAFAPDKIHLKEKIFGMRENLEDKITRQFDRYNKVAQNSPKLISPYKELNDFFMLIPMYHESLKITDYPGAIRAKTTHYGVWGWDGMTASYATAYWGDVEHIKNMLSFYERTAHPELGIGHGFNNDMTVASISAIPAQGMYITLLQLYYAISGDMEEVRKRYPFAKKIFRLISGREVADTGFCEGTSLYPDFPDRIKETGHDISSFNNTIFYCGARSMNYLAALVGDDVMREQAEAVFKKMEGNFIRLFYDPDKKFIVTSVDSETLEKRYCYDVASVKWENNYCDELIEPIIDDTLEFVAENAISEAGLREIPLWDDGFDGDANQMHCWWPVNTEYFIKLANLTNRNDLIQKWIGWVSRWTEKLMCPEGISYYIETDDPDTDSWNALPGTWHGYSMRGWYQAAVHGVVGVEADAGGLTFYPYDGAEVTLRGLHYMGKAFDIEIKGNGRYIEWIDVDGIKIKGTDKLPSDLYEGKDHVDIKVWRTSTEPQDAYIKCAHGIELTDYRFDNGKIKAKISGAGTCRIKIAAHKEPRVMVDQLAVPLRYAQDTRIATAEIKLNPAIVEELEIMQ
ncbi:hypothetical protein [Mahella australiensis]|uniref:Alpha-L-rhamnosidase six-hairpin glycosidase domain-containing protein n=1 Tax=Mahella australiensis (strain DSM 15567 / CIP 107919 / 50-1 BON) TaxID=697281 RepID=F3ZYQ4_MAHA5|nr:hypothetical protein [Mahella australiensis]AEE97822.1 hypothetical protein Mahau_2686 [Mahella australiensis 50-1 BON]